MSEVTLQLPELSDAQLRIASCSAPYNVVACGWDAGQDSLSLDVLLTHPLGALSGHRVALFAPDADTLLDAKRRMVDIVADLLVSKPDKNRLDLSTGGSILFVDLDQPRLNLWEQVSVAVFIECSAVDRLVDIWEREVHRLLVRDAHAAFFFGRPKGLKGGFHKLATLPGADWQTHYLPTWENPAHDPDQLARDREEMNPIAFEQERGGQFVDGVELSASQMIIGENETFVGWCERLAEDGLKVDNHPFTLDNRPAFRWIYEQIPSTIEQARGRTIVLMKCAQVGFTVMEILAKIYMALKFAPLQVGMYLPDQNLARIKSSERFLPIVRTIPDAYRLMVEGDGSKKLNNEGNVMIRSMGSSRFFFLWTSGKGATESVPLDVLSLDEVQEMRIADMEKVRERMSASRVRFTLAGSTANWPDQDIHFLFKKGTQHQFHTLCRSCGEHNVLDEYFPECIKYDDARRDYGYVCRSCGSFIPDPQDGSWVAKVPDAEVLSIHFPQFLSPTISAREIIESYYNADDLKNFYNRKLGKPFLDPSTVPVNMEMLNECAKEGMALGVVWKDRATETFMGIDQMGAFNVVLIAERLPTGQMALIHAEEIYSDDPFARCDDLIAQYGVQCCVVETLPNYNDAKRFANRHKGVVFLAGYMDMKEDMLRWGDAVPTKADRKTDEEDRDRYTVMLDQYKCMQVAMKRIQTKACVFPDPDGLLQEVKDKGQMVMKKLLREVIFFHFTRTGLIATKDEEERKYRRKVVKIGIDPHFSYAYMLLNIAWARAFGTTTFVLPHATAVPKVQQQVEKALPGLPQGVVRMMVDVDMQDGCGNCAFYDPNGGVCTERGFLVRAQDPPCPMHLPK